MSAKKWAFRIEGVPEVKGRARMEGGKVRTPTKTVGYEARVAGAAIENRVRWIDGYVFEVSIVVWLPDFRLKDGDNILKVILDGLQKGGARCLPGDDLFRVPKKTVEFGGVSRLKLGVDIEIIRRLARGSEEGSPESTKKIRVKG